MDLQRRGAVAGQATVSGDAFIAASYEYYYSHVWRNFGILWAFLIAFMAIYFTELNSATTSTAEALVFQRGHVPPHLQKGGKEAGQEDGVAEKAPQRPESGVSDVKGLQPQRDIFTWRDVIYDIEIKNEKRRLLDHVSGWVKPGTLTALMGVSGAGKTTLLDVLAQRTTMGVITGDMLVNGKPQDPSFQRNTGYVQQQNLHLETATVRESLRFSAMLRQPKTVSKKEKYEFVEDVIKMLNMEDFANAVVGVPGEGLNVEQRKLLTIGVELAAKLKLLLFLDEPTSGLDSQSSWAIYAFLRKLTNSGQAILGTVHQPSAILFQEFDRLLFLAKGGKTVYFGNVGQNFMTIFSTLVQQIHPLFITQRSLYEVRERPSKAYSWKAFIANIAVEIPYMIFTGILVFGCFYYPVIGVRSSERQGLVLLYVISLFIYSSAFAHMNIVTMPDAHTAASIVTILTLMSLMFCGVLQTPDALPGFWIFMYRVSPFTYWISGIVATELHGSPISCSATEMSVFNPPPNNDVRRVPGTASPESPRPAAEPPGDGAVSILLRQLCRPAAGWLEDLLVGSLAQLRHFLGIHCLCHLCRHSPVLPVPGQEVEHWLQVGLQAAVVEGQGRFLIGSRLFNV